MEKQEVFDLWCKGHAFGLRGDPPPRDWHIESVSDYAKSLAAWDEMHAGNGVAGPHVFTIYGGTGAGKTECAGNIVSLGLNQGRYRNVVFVCPNNTILGRAVEVFRDRFGIHLSPFNKPRSRHGRGWEVSHGYITNYQTLLKRPAIHREICGPEFVVIFDEIHHLGERSGWGECAEEAFGRVRHMIALTGSPFRNKSDPRIAFVRYEDVPGKALEKFKADVTYTLGKAVADGVCRRPAFLYHDATVKIGNEGEEGYRVITLADTVGKGAEAECLAGIRLAAAVKFGSHDRRCLLLKALPEIRRAGRKVIIFLGGDTDSDTLPTEDAKHVLPEELLSLGLGITEDEIEIITGDDKAAQNKIKTFGKSEKWIMIAVNMVTEGSDIPELSAEIHLTSVTAKQTTIQRIGRALRLRADDPFKDAWIYLFRDRYLYEISDEIESEIESEIAKTKAKKESEGGGDDPRPRSRVMAIGIGDAKLVEIKFGGESYTPEEFEAARQELRDLSMPATYIMEFMQLKMRRANGGGTVSGRRDAGE